MSNWDVLFSIIKSGSGSGSGTGVGSGAGCGLGAWGVVFVCVPDMLCVRVLIVGIRLSALLARDTVGRAVPAEPRDTTDAPFADVPMATITAATAVRKAFRCVRLKKLKTVSCCFIFCSLLQCIACQVMELAQLGRHRAF